MGLKKYTIGSLENYPKELFFIVLFLVYLIKLISVKFNFDYFTAFPEYLSYCLDKNELPNIYPKLGSDGGYYFIATKVFFKTNVCDNFLGYFYIRIVPLILAKISNLFFDNISLVFFLTNVMIVIFSTQLIEKIFNKKLNNFESFLLYFLFFFNFGNLSIIKFNLINFYPLIFSLIGYVYYKKKTIFFISNICSIFSFNFSIINYLKILIQNSKEIYIYISILLSAILYLIISYFLSKIYPIRGIESFFSSEFIVNFILKKEFINIKENYQFIIVTLSILPTSLLLLVYESNERNNCIIILLIFFITLLISNFEWKSGLFHFPRVCNFIYLFHIYHLIKFRNYYYIKIIFYGNIILGIGSIIWFLNF